MASGLGFRVYNRLWGGRLQGLGATVGSRVWGLP